MPSKRLTQQQAAEAFQFACYNAVHQIGKPVSAKEVAKHLKMPFRESEIRGILTRLCKQRALTRSRIDRIWHYFV
jgi:predicted transcriptional regulator